MKRTLTAALGAIAFLFLCGFSLTQPAPASSIQKKPICTGAPGANNVLQFASGQWCDTASLTLTSILLGYSASSGYSLEVLTPATGDAILVAGVTGDTQARYELLPGTGIQIGGGSAPPTTVINESHQWVGAAVGTGFGGTGLTTTTTTVTASGTFTTAASVPSYKVIAVGGGGGGGSSTGAGFGGNGSSAGLDVCELIGGGQAYTVTVGGGGAAGAAGLSGSPGTGSAVVAGTGATNCFTFPGLGGINGTASDGAGGGTAAGGGVTAMFDAATFGNAVGAVTLAVSSRAANVHGQAATATFGIAGGIGCAGASCTTDTAGASGEVIFIPEI